MSPFRAGLLTLLAIAVATYFGFTKSNPLADPFEVKAAFRTANDLKAGSQVRIAGVTVGKVEKVEGLGEGRGAVVTMAIDERGLPLHADTTMKVRPRIFLEGNWFVDVTPGSPSAPELEDGATVPVQQTAAPVQFGQLLETLQRDTREDLQTVLQEYGRATNSDAGDAFNRTIKYWKPAFRDSAIVNEAMLGEQHRDLRGYLRGSARVARGLDRDPEALKGLITDFATTAEAFASEQRNLSATIRQLPRTLRAGRAAFAALRGAFPSVRRFVVDMRPAVRSSGPALDAALPFVRQMRGLMSTPELRGLVRDLRPVVPDLVEINRGGLGLQEQTRLVSSCQLQVLLPWNDSKIPDPNFPPPGPIYQEASKQFVGLAGESRSFDANGQYVRSLANNANYAYPVGDGRFYLTSLPIQGANPPKKETPPPYRPDVDCETQEPPDLRSTAAAPPAGFRIAQDAPGAADRRAKARDAAMDWMRDQLKMTGLDEKLQLSDEPLAPGEIDDVKRTLEGAR